MPELCNSRNDLYYINELREKIRMLERSLAEYGFDYRRGIETWKISELKKMLFKAGGSGRVKEILKELVETQETLYYELYQLAGAKEIAVDTDTPEKRLKEIKSWLEGRQRNEGNRKGLFAKAVREVLESFERNETPVSVVETLNHIYKRDYDRFRVLKFVLSLCKEIDASIEEPKQQDLNNIANVVVLALSRVGVDKVRKLARVELGT